MDTPQRQYLTDGTARWFDYTKAERFDESTTWDGNNNVSVATGSQWDHEVLYNTRGGVWVMHTHSQRQGVMETWRMVPETEAYAWLVRQGHTDVVPAEFLDTQEV
jgi:hypothetical protein